MLRRTLAGDPGPAQDVLALNAGAAIYVGGGAPTLAAGVNLAQRYHRHGSRARYNRKDAPRE